MFNNLNLNAAGDVLNSGLTSIGKLAWVLYILLGVAVLISAVYLHRQFKKKKAQWTHKIRIRRVDKYDHLIPGEEVYLARRNRNKDGVDIFETQKPILGNPVIPDLGEYSDKNEFSIILDKNNRIYRNTEEIFNRDKQSIEISGIHAGIDIAMQDLNNEWKQMHPVSKKITAMEVIKAGLTALAIIAIMIIGIVALQQHAKTTTAKAQADLAIANAMDKFASSVPVLEGIINTQQLQIVPQLKALYPNQDISKIIDKYRVNSTNTSN